MERNLTARAAGNPDWRRKVMQSFFGWACAALVLGCFVFGQQSQDGTNQPTKSTAQADLTNLLDAKIKAEWQAIKNKDQKSYGELLTDDYVAVEADGRGERYKRKALSELQQSTVTDYTLSFLKVTTLCLAVNRLRLRWRKVYWQSGGMEARASSEPHGRFFFAGASPGLE